MSLRLLDAVRTETDPKPRNSLSSCNVPYAQKIILKTTFNITLIMYLRMT